MTPSTSPASTSTTTESQASALEPIIPVDRKVDLATGVEADVTNAFDDLAKEFLDEDSDSTPVAIATENKPIASAIPPSDSIPLPSVPAAPAVATTEPATAPGDPTATPPTPPVVPVVKTAVEFQQDLDTAEKRLADEYYKLSPDDAQKIIAEPETEFPKYMAKVHMSVLQTTMAALATHMPQIIETVHQNNRAWEQGTTAFFDAWPDLKDPKLHDGIRRIAETYVALNPQTDLTTRVKEIGVQAHMMYRIPLPGMPVGEAPSAVLTAHRPAQGGAGTLPRILPNQNQYSQLAEEFISEDG